MRARTQGFVSATLLVLTVMWVGCGDKGEEVNEAAEAEYAALLENQEQLAELREELADLREEAKSAAEEAAEEVEDAADDAAEEVEEALDDAQEPSLEERIADVEAKIKEAADGMGEKIANFLNNVDPMLEGEEPSERQMTVLRMKSAEDMVIASEYIQKGGDYRRAIRIYEDALVYDPENEELQAALAKANEMRFMTEERLASVKKGMTEDEVLELLGPVNLRNKRDYPERNVVAWFYPVDENGAASAVWFRKNRNGQLAVYKTDFNQLKGREDEPAEG